MAAALLRAAREFHRNRDRDESRCEDGVQVDVDLSEVDTHGATRATRQRERRAVGGWQSGRCGGSVLGPWRQRRFPVIEYSAVMIGNCLDSAEGFESRCGTNAVAAQRIIRSRRLLAGASKLIPLLVGSFHAQIRLQQTRLADVQQAVDSISNTWSR